MVAIETMGEQMDPVMMNPLSAEMKCTHQLDK